MTAKFSNNLILLFSTGFILFLFSTLIPVPAGRLDRTTRQSFRIYDRNHILLREVLSADGTRMQPVDLSALPGLVTRPFLTAEDKRFHLHGGIDLFALMRAVRQNLSSGRIISGASTITMQLARAIGGRERNFSAKLYEAWLALRLENTLGKEQVLQEYLNRIPFSNQVFGLGAAARFYFNKSADELTLNESAFLAAIPRSPTRLNPFREAAQINRLRADIIRRCSRDSLPDVIPFERPDRFPAPHFTDFVLRNSKTDSVGEVITSLDLVWQNEAERIVEQHLAMLSGKNASNASVLVLDNTNAAIRVMVGSANYNLSDIDGQVNGTLAPRQAGSVLKPFTYGLAFEQGMHPGMLINDDEFFSPTVSGTYTPQNYDRQFHGRVSLRDALASSLNIPAVRLLDQLGPDLLFHKLQQAGFRNMAHDPDYYGPGLALGNTEVTLMELAGAYCALANHGIWRPVPFQLSAAPYNSSAVFSPQTSFLLSDILSDPTARMAGFGLASLLELPFPCAVKTGTSKNYRDNWCIGYTRDYTVAVWVGNFDGSPMRGVSGITGAAPILHDLFLYLHHDQAPAEFTAPDDLIMRSLCRDSGKPAGISCRRIYPEWLHRDRDDYCTCDGRHQPGPGVQTADNIIIAPGDGMVFKRDATVPDRFQHIALRLAFGDNDETILVQGNFFPEKRVRSGDRVMLPLIAGTHTLTARIISGHRSGLTHEITFTVLP